MEIWVSQISGFLLLFKVSLQPEAQTLQKGVCDPLGLPMVQKYVLKYRLTWIDHIIQKISLHIHVGPTHVVGGPYSISYIWSKSCPQMIPSITVTNRNTLIILLDDNKTIRMVKLYCHMVKVWSLYVLGFVRFVCCPVFSWCFPALRVCVCSVSSVCAGWACLTHASHHLISSCSIWFTLPDSDSLLFLLW